MELKGTIKQIGNIETFGNNFQKRNFVITTAEQYPQHILLELHKDRVDIIEPLSVGDRVTVAINIRGREWTSPQGEVKYFNSLVAWNIVKDTATQQSPTTYQPPQPKKQSPAEMLEEEDDDLPF